MCPLPVACLYTSRLIRRVAGTGSINHYSIGSYEEDDGVFKAKIVVTQHGGVRTMFGSKKKQVKLQVEGKVGKEGDEVFISGTARPSKSDRFEVGVYLIRLGTLD